MSEDRALANLATMSIDDYLILERAMCDCEPICTCRWDDILKEAE